MNKVSINLAAATR